MKPHRAVALLLVFFAAHLVQAKGKKQSGLPAVVGQARYVYVEAVDGKEFDPNLWPEDREAIADVRDALGSWNRYTLTTEREQADLVIVVRKGRAASADMGVSPRGGPNSGGPASTGPASTGPFSGQSRTGGQMGGPGVQTVGELGPPDDLLEVCQIDANGKLSSPLWERSMPEGLDAPRILLFRQFRDAVEKAYPSQPAGQAQKP